jgi:predicted methyltransferase
MPAPAILSYIQAQTLEQARRAKRSHASISLDLGQTTVEVDLEAAGIRLPGGSVIGWAAVQEVLKAEPICCQVNGTQVTKVHRFSPRLHRAYSLMATRGAPTLINSGFTMHRIVDIDPWEDTLRKVRALGNPRGRVLDTATGLGYTAVELAKTASWVLTCELDPLVLEIAQLNPWSAPLFTTPRIEQRIADITAAIMAMEDRGFDAVLHDPPTVSLAGDLYGGALYRELFRVLRPGGSLFHYVGNLQSKAGGTAGKGVMRRLREAGFARVTPRPEAFGYTAQRP